MHRGVCHPSGTGTAKVILGMPLDAALRPARAILAVDHAFMDGIVAECTGGALPALGRQQGWSDRGERLANLVVIPPRPLPSGCRSGSFCGRREIC
jgi:hypothetical protein